MVQLDSVNYTSSSEYSNRTRSITHLQIHHATTTSLAGLRALMAPGGRTVSANGAMGNDGHLMGVVPENKRAFTSASSFDNNSYTIEVCNTTLGPQWGISDACHWRLAQVAVDLHREYGMPLDRAHIIGHYEVPGTYPTACPGPSMDLGRIVRYAYELLADTAGGGSKPIEEEVDMRVYQRTGAGNAVYALGQEYIHNLGTGGTATAFAKNYTNQPVMEVDEVFWKNLLFGLGIPYDKVPGTNGIWSRARDAVIAAQNAEKNILAALEAQTP